MYFAIYKMNATKATNDYLGNYDEDAPYMPTDGGACYMDEDNTITMWMMNDDWYLMIKYDEESEFHKDCPFATIEWHIKDAYATIKEPYEEGKAKLIFENELVD